MPSRVSRLAVHAVLTLFAAFYLVPLAVVMLNSVRSTQEINHTVDDRPAARLRLEQFQLRPGAITVSPSIARASSHISGTRWRW